VVIACGGDGTVRACVEGLAGTQTPLAVVPAGTGNLLARNLDLPEEPRKAIEVALSGGRRRLDVGYVNGEAFAIMAGAGFDAAIMRDTDGDRKDRIGALAYVETALRHLRDERVGAVVRVDGRSVFDGDVATVVVGNLGRLQGGMEVLPEALPDDGVLDVLAAGPDGPLTWLRTAWDVLLRRPRSDLLKRWTGSRIDVHIARPTPYQLDGEVRRATTHLGFGVRPLAIAVCVPREEG
jgi:diacylglycerol kinase family enzyme